MIPRTLRLEKFLDAMSSVLLLGPRGTGKTALVKAALSNKALTTNDGARDSLIIDLLNGRDYLHYLSDPHLFYSEIESQLKATSTKLIVAIDEVQRLPALLNEVHALIETYKGRVVFIMTGSSARKLRRGGANLLAGRAIRRYLYPLHQSELDLDLKKALLRGTLPEIYLESLELAMLRLETYVNTYLKEEIQQESLVRSVERFSRFLEFACQTNGEPVNFSKLAKQIGIAGKTVQDYFTILTDTLLAIEVSGWSHSVKKQLLLAPKYYFFDTGVLNAIGGYLRLELKESSFLFGRLFETFVISQLAAINDYKDLGLKFFYWRDKNGREIDLVLARNVVTPLLAVAIKSSSSPSAEDCTGFDSFNDDYPDVPKICVCNTPRSYEKGGIKFIPWAEFVVAPEKLL